MDTERIEAPRATPALAHAGFKPRLRTIGVALFVAAWLAATALVARSNLGVQSLVMVAAVFGVLAISLDLVAGMLGLYSLGQGGFFAIGAYFTTIVVNSLGWNVFLVLLIVLLVAGVVGLAVGAMSLRVSGLYFAITTFIFTLVLTVLATDLKITGGLQGLLGPAFPDFPLALEALGTPVAWCVMLALLLCIGFVWSIRQSPLYPVLLVDPRRRALRGGGRRTHFAHQDRRLRRLRRDGWRRRMAVLVPRRRFARTIRLVGVAQHPRHGADRRHQHDRLGR